MGVEGSCAVPLDKSGTKASVSRNISRLVAEGRPQKQAVAIALDTQRRTKRRRRTRTRAAGSASAA